MALICLISKKATLHVQHSFFVHFFLPLFCTTTTWNLQKLLSDTFYGGNVVRVLVHFFFYCRSISPSALVAASISYFLTATTKLSCCSSNKKCLLCCLSLSLDLCCPFSGWASLACRLLSLFLCLSLPLFSKFVDVTVNLSLIVQTTRIHGNNSRFPFSTLRSNDADVQRERKKKRFNKQNNNFARASHIFVHFFAVFARLRRENA